MFTDPRCLPAAGRANAPASESPLTVFEENIVKRTYQPSNTRRKRTHGFRARMATHGGRLVINARRRKGRKRIAL